jgi:hypothetical protein
MHHPKPVEMPHGFRIRYLTSPLSRSEQQQFTTNPDKPMTETRYPGDDKGDLVIKGGVARYVAKTPFDRDEETGKPESSDRQGTSLRDEAEPLSSDTNF